MQESGRPRWRQLEQGAAGENADCRRESASGESDATASNKKSLEVDAKRSDVCAEVNDLWQPGSDGTNTDSREKSRAEGAGDSVPANSKKARDSRSPGGRGSRKMMHTKRSGSSEKGAHSTDAATGEPVDGDVATRASHSVPGQEGRGRRRQHNNRRGGGEGRSRARRSGRDDSGRQARQAQQANGYHQSSEELNLEEELLPLRLLMTSKDAGSVIGKQGENIKHLRETSECHISMSDDHRAAERILTIDGNFRGVVKALHDICFKLDEDNARFQSQRLGSTGRHASNGAGSNGTASDRTTPGHISVVVIVPAVQCGPLIGKGGSKIRELRRISGASIQVASESLPDSTERTVRINGVPGVVSHALHDVCRILVENPSVQPVTFYRPDRTNHGGLGNYAPLGVSRQYEYGGRRNRSPLMGRSGQPGINRGHSRQSQSTAAYGPQSQNQQARGGGGGGHHQYGTPGGSSMSKASSGIEETLNRLPNGEVEVHLRVPNDIVGCIIGKQGQTISEIRKTSGATITISEAPSSNSNEYLSRNSHVVVKARERVISLRGHANCVQCARYLMGNAILLAQQQPTSPGGPPYPQVASPSTSGSPYQYGANSHVSHVSHANQQQHQHIRGVPSNPLHSQSTTAPGNNGTGLGNSGSNGSSAGPSHSGSLNRGPSHGSVTTEPVSAHQAHPAGGHRR